MKKTCWQSKHCQMIISHDILNENPELFLVKNYKKNYMMIWDIISQELKLNWNVLSLICYIEFFVGNIKILRYNKNK